jgi:hypothetical protein
MRQTSGKLKKKFDYPDETEGSRIAAKARQMASKHTLEERRAHINAAMVMIYGGSDAKKTTLAGH